MRSPAESDKVDSLLRAMSRVLLSELIGRINDEDVAFGDPVAEIRLGLAAPRAALEPGDTDELDAGGERISDASSVEIEETLTLRVAPARVSRSAIGSTPRDPSSWRRSRAGRSGNCWKRRCKIFRR